MKGHIRERSPGRWAIVIDVPDPQTGKRKRRWHSFAGTKRQAQIECARLISELQSGTYVDPTRVTVAAFLDRWIEHMGGQVSPRIARAICRDARKNLAPLLGGSPLAKLQPAHISAAYAKALTSGRRDGQGRAFRREPSTHMHRVLRQASSRPWGGNCSPATRPISLSRQGRAQADADPRRRRNGRADRGGAGNQPIYANPAWRPLRAAPRRDGGPALALGRS